MKKEVIVRDVEEIPPEIHRWGKIWNLITGTDTEKGSAALLKMTGPNCMQFTKVAERFYFILEGEGEVVAGSQTYPVKEGSVLRIPKMTPHRLVPREKLKVLVVSMPPYSDEDTIY